MSKPTKAKPQKKESRKEAIARIAADNRAYFEKLDRQEQKQTRRQAIAEKVAVNHAPVLTLEKANEPPPVMYICPHCKKECAVGNDLIGSDVKCPFCSNIFNATIDAPQTLQTPRLIKPTSKSSAIAASFAAFAVIMVLGFFMCWGIYALCTISPDKQNSQPEAAAQPNSQTTPESVADFNSRMEAKEMVRRRFQMDNGGAPENAEPKTGKYVISSERAEKYLGPTAREEMRDYLKQNGSPNPSDSDIDFALKLNGTA